MVPPELPGWLARQLPFARTLHDVGGGHRMHLMSDGPADGSPVLLLHGNPTWGFLYRKVAFALAGAGLRVLMPDLLGLGLSDHPAAAFHTIEHHAQALGALVDQLGLERVTLVVQDWGGPIALRAFADRQDRLAGLVLLNTVVGPPRPGFKPTTFHRLARLPLVSTLIFRGLGFPQNALALAQGDRRSIRGDVAHAYRWPLAGLRHNAAPLALARMVPDSQTHPSIPALQRCQELVESFKGPVELVWGDRDPILGRVRPWIEKLLPHARVTRTQAGHFLQEEVPEEIAASVRRVAAAAVPGD